MFTAGKLINPTPHLSDPADRRLWRVVLCAALIVLIASERIFAQFGFGELIAVESPGNTTYYLDAESGDDEHSGTRPGRAWRTLAQVNSTRFAPGDKLLIKAGTVHEGRLWPKGSGRPGNPITIDSYGEGDRPAIHAGGETGEALLLENTQGWHINNLELSNTGEKPEAFRFGLSITVEGMGSAGDFKLTNLYVHDVNGATEPGLGEGAGIIWRSRGAQIQTRYEGLLIENCTIKNCGRNGIMSLNDSANRRRWLPNTDVIVRENEITDVSGDGIRLEGCVNAMVEYNRVQSAGGAADGKAGGIVLIGCDNSLVQYNEIWQTQGKDNAALLSGTNNRENTFQFNYTHDNDGPMAAVRTGNGNRIDAAQLGADAGNLQTAVRYNISQNDGAVLKVDGPCQGTRFHNNTVFTGAEHDSVVLRILDQPAPPTGLILANNLFYTLGTMSLDLSLAGDAQVMHNAYFGSIDGPEDEPEAVRDDPKLAQPGVGTTLREGLNGYQTHEDSPLRDAGIRLGDHGNHDFWGNSVPRGEVIDIGAHQGPSDNEARPAQPVQTP